MNNMKIILLYSIILGGILNYALKVGYIFNTPIITILSSIIICLIPFLLYLIKPKNLYIKKYQNIYLILCSVFISLFIIYSFNIYKHNPQIPIEIELSATNSKNEMSQGERIVFYSLKIDNKTIPFENLKINGHYENTDAAAAWKMPPEENLKCIELYNSKLQFSGKGNNIYLILLGGNDTGIASLKINNKQYKLDTYQNIEKAEIVQDKKLSMEYAFPYTFEANKYLSFADRISKIIYITFNFLIYFFSVYFLGLICLNTNICIKKIKDKASVSSFILYSLPIIIIGIFYILTFYPGIMPFDTIVQWYQSHLKLYDDSHPIISTLLITFITKIYDSPITVVIVQILSFATAIGYFFSKIEKYAIPKQILLFISILIAITPFNSIMLVSLWKDVIFNICLFTVFMCILLIVIEGLDVFLKSRLNSFLFIISLLLITYTRYSGMHICFAVLLIMLISLKNYWKSFIKVICIYAVFSLIISNIVIRNINYEVKPFIHNQTFEVLIHQIQTVIKYTPPP